MHCILWYHIAIIIACAICYRWENPFFINSPQICYYPIQGLVKEDQELSIFFLKVKWNQVMIIMYSNNTDVGFQYE